MATTRKQMDAAKLVRERKCRKMPVDGMKQTQQTIATSTLDDGCGRVLHCCATDAAANNDNNGTVIQWPEWLWWWWKEVEQQSRCGTTIQQQQQQWQHCGDNRREGQWNFNSAIIVTTHCQCQQQSATSSDSICVAAFFPSSSSSNASQSSPSSCRRHYLLPPPMPGAIHHHPFHTKFVSAHRSRLALPTVPIPIVTLFLLLLSSILPFLTALAQSSQPDFAAIPSKQRQHIDLHPHRWRRMAATKEGEVNVAQPQTQQQSHHHRHNILFRYQCPQGCLCVPDIVDIELLIISCRWPTLGPQAFEHFPRNGTKSLAITCSNSGSDNIETATAANSLLATPNAFHGFSELRELRIVGCSTRQLASTLLTGAHRLHLLSLSQMSVMEHLEVDFFAQLAQLEKLTLAEAGLRELPTDGICHMGQLMVLNMSHNALESARLGIHWPRPGSQQSCQLEQLLMLDLSGNPIALLTEHDLRPFPALRHLSLRSTGLVEIQPDAFRFAAPSAPLLQHLDLTDNRLEDVPAHSGLPDTLLQLDLANNRLRAIPTAVSKLVALNRLDLSGNAIGEMAENAEEEQKSEGAMMLPLQSAGLEHLDLSRNVLRHIPVKLFAESADALRTLRLAGNRIEQLEPELMQNLSQLHELDLSHNQLTVLPQGAFTGLGELALLHLANNSIHQVDMEVFQDVGRTLHTLNMAQNLLTELPVAVGRLSRVKRIDLSRNKISKAYKFVLNKLPHLARLDLSQNVLQSVDSYVFKECDHLQELNLRANRIQTISPDAFEKCSRLKRLDLAENQLNTVGPALRVLASLLTVNLTGNQLDELNWAHFPVDLLELFANGNQIKRIGTLDDGDAAAVAVGDGISPAAAMPELEAGEQSNDGGRKLKRLELKANKLVRLWADSLPLSLEELDLSDNQLTLMANSTFNGMGQLKMVNLRHNNLRTIPRELYEQTIGRNAPFGRMWIAGNPLECNCEMGWLLNSTGSSIGAVGLQAQETRENGIAIGGGSTGGIRDISEAECLIPLSADRKLVTQTVASDFLCPYAQFCGPGCGCCQFWKCDCKSRCPKGCTCFRDRHAATNVVKCARTNGGDKQQQQHQRGMEEESGLDLKEFPMEATHIFISGLNIPTLKENDFAGRNRLLALHINASGVRKIQRRAFNTLFNLKSLHLADNMLGDFSEKDNLTEKDEYDILHRTPNILQLNLANNELNEQNMQLAKIIPKLEHLEQLNLDGNAFRELPTYLKSSFNNRLNQISLSGNLFRCDCSQTGRYDTPSWLTKNRQRVLDAEWVQCVENVTWAKVQNDSTVLSTYVPNVGEHLYVFPMLEFFNEENRTLCVLPSNGWFGINGTWNTLLFMCALIIVPIVLMIMLIMFAHSFLFGAKSKGRTSRSSNEETMKFLQNNSPTSTTNGGSPLPGSIIDVPPVEPEECDFFVCCSKKDEPLMQEFFGPMEMKGYTVCYLHRCGLYCEGMYNLKLRNLLLNTGMVVIYLSHEFLRKEWNQPQFEWFQPQPVLMYNTNEELKGKHKFIILSGEMKEELTTQSKDTAVGRFVRSCGSFTLDTPFLRKEIVRWLRHERSPSISENSHIYSEYGQIQSEFV